MAQEVKAEAYLRLACERLLLSGGARHGPGNFEIDPVGRAFMAAGLLDRDEVTGILTEYAMALKLRGENGFMFASGVDPGAGPGRRLTVKRVVVGDLEFGDEEHRMTLRRIVFGEENTELELSGLESGNRPGPGRLRPGRFPMHMVQHGPIHPGSMSVRDDRGTVATAHFGRGGSSGRSWDAHLTTDVPLSAATAWIEIDGARLDLPEPAATPLEVRLEGYEPGEPLRALLFGEVLAGDGMRGERPSVDVAIDALVAVGALDHHDPVVREVELVSSVVHEGKPVQGLSSPWAEMAARLSKHDGPVGNIVVGVAVESLEGFSVRFDSLDSEPDSFSVSVAISPGWPLLMGFPGVRLESSPITWWAEDDRGNSYLLLGGATGGGSSDLAEGALVSLTPLDPRATELRLLPTGRALRAVVTVPLHNLRGER